jgi:hypothetical protein
MYRASLSVLPALGGATLADLHGLLIGPTTASDRRELLQQLEEGRRPQRRYRRQGGGCGCFTEALLKGVNASDIIAMRRRS